MNGFTAYMLTAAWEEFLLFLFLWGPLFLLAVMCAATLDKLPPQQRRGLFPLFVVLLVLAAVLFGGAALLERNGLAWRTWPQEIMSLVLWLAGLATGILTIVYAGHWLAERGGAMKTAVTIFAVLCLVSAMCVGTIAGLLWCMGPGEQVVAYQGRKMILGKWTWMDTSFSLYEYYGPLVRGAVPISDFDWALLKGAVIDAG